MNIALIGCTKHKLDYPRPVHEMYPPSSVFRKAKTCCEWRSSA